MADIQTINATAFKAQCLEILDRLGRRQLERVIITKRGRTVAILTPPDSDADAVRNIHGFLRGGVTIPEGFDLTAPVCDEPLSAELGELHG
jgi:antitoxin (DNA-binding transcriptional repressor) of toxin-antitoxin stability system